MLYIILTIVAIAILCKPIICLFLIVKTFWKELLFYIACVGCNILYYAIGMDKIFPVKPYEKVICWIFAILAPYYWRWKKKEKKK